MKNKTEKEWTMNTIKQIRQQFTHDVSFEYYWLVVFLHETENRILPVEL